jgi:DNA-directed RNA polymerase subunit omega
MNAELCKKALERIQNPNILVNLVSRRVRQLASGGGTMSKPLVPVTHNMSLADIALLEIAEGKITYELPTETGVLIGSDRPQKRKH